MTIEVQGTMAIILIAISSIVISWLIYGWLVKDIIQGISEAWKEKDYGCFLFLLSWMLFIGFFVVIIISILRWVISIFT